MKLKPSVFVKNSFLESQFKKSLCSDDDIIYLEDDTGRVVLDLSAIKPLTTE